MFYTGQADVLAREVGSMLAGVAGGESAAPKALIVPHAGYIYSGPIAAHAYGRLQGLRGTVRRVVLLGPAHRVWVRGLALPASEAFATPLGVVPLDREAMNAVLDLPQVSVRDDVHALEHSLEVQLPFLQTVLGDFSLVPFAVGDARPEEVGAVLERLWGGPETLIVISSDLSHYLPYHTAQQVDGETALSILALRQLVSHEQACGSIPVNGLLALARRRNLRAEQLDLRNSGDTAGSRDKVVGYGAFAFYEEPGHAA
jgi:hypothetical protein